MFGAPRDTRGAPRLPTCQPSHAIASTSATITAIAEMRESCDSTASVVLESPAKTSPTTGSTGAPQPTTLHGPVDNPSTLTQAPTAPPARPAPVCQPLATAPRRARDGEHERRQEHVERHDAGGDQRHRAPPDANRAPNAAQGGADGRREPSDHALHYSGRHSGRLDSGQTSVLQRVHVVSGRGDPERALTNGGHTWRK